jgi:hypothetical protein
MLNLNDTEFVFQATEGQEVIYTIIQEHLDRVNADVLAAISVFVDRMTENHKERYKLPGGGFLQDLGQNPQAQAAAVKTFGGWDVAYPLTEYGAQIAGSRVTNAYMTVDDLDRHVKGVVEQNVRTVRRLLQTALLDNTQDTFVDINWGSLSIEPLANDDTVVYPPVIGSGIEATEDHYLESGYTSANISDTNNPYVTIEADLVHHFGESQGNDNVVVFINKAEKAVTQDLTDFIEITDIGIIPGTQTATLTGLPTSHPGRVIGRTNGCWVVEWNWMPANYMLGIYLEAEAPLKMRIDPAAVGLGTGLQLIAEDEIYPITQSHWSHRTGFGSGNRLNGVAMELGTGGTYTVPTIP